MKKILIFLLILSILLGCCSCGNEPVKKNDSNISNNNVNSQIDNNSSNTENDTVSNAENETVLNTENDTVSNMENDAVSDTELEDENSSLDDFIYNDDADDTDSSISSPSVTNPAVTKNRIPDGTKLFDGNYDAYYTVRPKDEHPGVVNMDAKYEMKIYDYNGNIISSNDIILEVNNPAVKVIGTTLIVPYSVRQGYERLIVTVHNKKDTKKKGKYRFDFLKFTDESTFYDDFSMDYGNWGVDPYEADARLPVIKNGYMELTLDEDRVGKRTSTNNFKQAYGCFSANLTEPPANCNGDASFWLFTGSSGYIPNNESPVDSSGEIDVIEFIPYTKTALHTVHWFGYDTYHKENNTQTEVTYDYTKFNTYSVVWTPRQIFWYINGELYKTATGVEEGVAKASVPMYMILQCHYIQESFGFGWASEDVLPYTCYVDWVDVYGLIID